MVYMIEKEFQNLYQLDNLSVYIFIMIQKYEYRNQLYRQNSIDLIAASKRINILEKLKLIKLHKIGRLVKLEYTENGIKILNHFLEINKLIN